MSFEEWLDRRVKSTMGVIKNMRETVMDDPDRQRLIDALDRRVDEMLHARSLYQVWKSEHEENQQ